MAINGTRVTVGTTATLLTPTGFTNPISSNQQGISLLVQNPSSVTVFIGGSDVTTTGYGFALAVNQSIAVDLQSDELLYAVVASGTQTVNVLRQGV
jgi:hypothetical protein